MKTILVSDLMNIKPVLDKMINVPMAAKDTFKVLRLMKELEKEYISLSEAWKNLSERYGLKDSKEQFVMENGSIVINPAFKEQYIAEFQQLMNQKVEVQHTISESALEKIEITPSQLSALINLIEE